MSKLKVGVYTVNLEELAKLTKLELDRTESRKFDLEDFSEVSVEAKVADELAAYMKGEEGSTLYIPRDELPEIAATVTHEIGRP